MDIKGISNKYIDELIEDPRTLAYLLGYDKCTLDIHKFWIGSAIFSNKLEAFQGHRGSYKTTSICVVGVIGRQLLFPNEDILLLRKSISKAAETFKEIKSQWERNTELQDLYELIHGVHPLTEDWSSRDGINLGAKTRITKHRSLEYAGIESAITGAHHDRIYADDIVTLEDRMYKTQRERTSINMMEIRNNILNPGGTCVISGTPWHPDDYFKELKDQGVVIHKYDINETQIPGFTEEKKKQLKKQMSVSMYAANYELKHLADSDRWFGNPQFTEMPPDLYIRIYVDPAFGGNDYTAATIGAVKDNKIYIVAADAWNEDIEETANRIFKLFGQFAAQEIIIEDNGAQKALLLYLKKLGLLNIRGKTNTENKFLRIEREVKGQWSNIYFNEKPKAIGPEYLSQLVDYEAPEDYKKKPNTRYDSPDSLAGLIKEINPFGHTNKGYEVISWL